MEGRWPEDLAALETEIRKTGRIGADHVLQLRRAIYRNGSIGREEAEFLFHLNRRSRGDDPAWAEFYVEALTDFFYWREGSDSQLTEDAEKMLFEWIGRQPAVDDPTELRLLLNLIFRTTACSERFRALVQKAVERSVLHSEHALFGHAGRRPGAIDKADVEVIRRLVYGTGSQHGLAISRAEAEFLFALNRATAGAENDPAWRELFVKAITMHLLFGGDSPESVDADEAAWLIDQMGAGATHEANERALLAYLKQEAASLHPLLDPLCQRFGVGRSDAKA
jgi:hypothetical protein